MPIIHDYALIQVQNPELGRAKLGIPEPVQPGPAPVDGLPKHASTHEAGGSDALRVDGLTGVLATAQRPVTHNILTSHDGFMAGPSQFMRGDGRFAELPDFTLRSYTPGAFTIPSGRYVITSNRIYLSGTQRATLVGTARWRHT